MASSASPAAATAPPAHPRQRVGAQDTDSDTISDDDTSLLIGRANARSARKAQGAEEREASEEETRGPISREAWRAAATFGGRVAVPLAPQRGVAAGARRSARGALAPLRARA